MSRGRRIASWSLSLRGVVAFLIGASADEVVRARQDPPPQQQQEPPAQEQPGRGGRGDSAAGAASVRAGHHRGRENRRRHLQGASRRRHAVLRDSEERAGQGLRLERARSRRRRSAPGFGGQNVSSRVVRWVEARRSHPAPGRRLQHHVERRRHGGAGGRRTPTIRRSFARCQSRPTRRTVTPSST